MGKNIIFWTNILSPHLIPFIREINLGDSTYEVYCVINQEMSLEREELGWKAVTDSQNFNIIFKGHEREILKNENCIHIFGGLKIFKKVYRKYPMLQGMKVLISESPNQEGLKGKLRILYGYIYEFNYRNSFDYILAIGNYTKKWYERFYFKNIFKFIYVTAFPSNGEIELKVVNNKIKTFVYIGSFNKRKGVDILIKSFVKLKVENWKLDLYGNGIDEADLKIVIKKHGLENKISFKGIVSNDKISQVLVKYDYSIQPSRFDGWNAVINESLIVGTPVLTSKYCGGIEIIKGFSGYIFDPHDKFEFIKILTKIIKNESEISDKFAIRNYYTSRIAPKRIAKYFLKIIEEDGTSVNSITKSPWDK